MVGRRHFPNEPLTERERQIIELIAAGLTNQQIADQLYLTLDTVKWYNKQIYQKLGVHSRTQAVASTRELAMPRTATPTTKHNLPEHDTIFIGRSQELAAIQARLADPVCRLLTLLGPGGIGKTRLAIETASRQLASYPDGVYLVPFAPVQSPEFVVQALADGIGLTLTNQRAALEQLINYLREKRLLLLVDNFEHLLEGAHLLSEVLMRTNALQVLVTSRARLRLKEEWVLDVQGLRFLLAGEEIREGTTATDDEAGQLFVWTAQRVKADFVADETNQAHVARICQLVGGMPLGIELAASWVRLLSCAEIARGIAQDLNMLTASWRNVPERHRSIQVVLDHSWKLLAADEQDLFRRLTIFSGPFRREAALAVTDTSLPMLLSLVDKSFLRRVDQERFGIHELLKQYGSGKLRADPAMWSATQLRHCRYHVTFLYERMSAPDAGVYLGEIEDVFDDIQVAWRYAVENCRLAEIQQLAVGFQVYYRLHSWYRAGSGAIALYQRALACFGPVTQTREQHTTLACLYESLGDLQEFATAHTDARAAFEKALGNTVGNEYVQRGRLLGKIADTWVDIHQYESAHHYYSLAESALENEPQHDVAWWGEWLHLKTRRMELYYWQNKPDAMADLAHQIDRLVEQHGALTQRMRYRHMLGMMALQRDRYFHSSEAITYSREALALSLETGNLSEIASRHFNLGFSYLWSEQFDKAEIHFQIAREMTEQNGDLTLLARALAYLTVIYRKQDNAGHVHKFAAYALKIAEEAKIAAYVGMAQAQFAWLAWCTRDLAKTRREAMTAIEKWGGLELPQPGLPFRWLALFPLLGVALQEEEIALAVQLAKHLIMPAQQRLPDELTTSLEGAIAAGDSGQWDVASNLLHQALQLAHDLHYL